MCLLLGTRLQSLDHPDWLPFARRRFKVLSPALELHGPFEDGVWRVGT